MRRKLFLVLAVVCIAAVFAGVFAGCNNGDGKGNGGGDKIFTEGASLEEILTALENAESFTQTQWWKESGTDHWGDEYAYEVTYRYEVTDSAVVQHSESFEGAEPTSSVLAQYRSGDIDYAMEYAEDGEIYGCSKSLATIYPDQFSYNMEQFGAGRFGDMPVKYADGKISFDHESAENNAIDGYVKGSGYVRLNGSSIEIGWEGEHSDEYGSYRYSCKYSWSGVNAKVEIPADARALEAQAEWASYVTYNGVEYEKETDENGDEYYFIRHAEEGSVIEKTINTLPVKERA